MVVFLLVQNSTSTPTINNKNDEFFSREQHHSSNRSAKINWFGTSIITRGTQRRERIVQENCCEILPILLVIYSILATGAGG